MGVGWGLLEATGSIIPGLHSAPIPMPPMLQPTLLLHLWPLDPGRCPHTLMAPPDTRHTPYTGEHLEQTFTEHVWEGVLPAHGDYMSKIMIMAIPILCL